MFLTICIPAYKRASFLERLLESIAIQRFRDFDVVITDDSPDDSVRQLALRYADKFPVAYVKNDPVLGTPENWNEGIRHATGEWIKIMHDDDWFARPDSLEKFAETAKKSPQNVLIFAGYQNYYFETGQFRPFPVSPWWMKRLMRNPVVLSSRNVIGAPSVTLIRRGTDLWYDKNVKWLVDIDYYIRVLSQATPVYIPDVLVNIGIGEEQVTQNCFRQREVEIPEAFYLFSKVGFRQLADIVVYDAWWRMLRNLEIRSEKDIFDAGYRKPIPEPIRSMIRWQSRLPSKLLKIGVFSKIAMAASYLRNRKKI